jgi:5'-nucleotidase
VAKETKWVLSGINAGGNLEVDIYISRTVAAVRKAVMDKIHCYFPLV